MSTPHRTLTRRPSLPTHVLPRLPRSLSNSHPKLTVAKLSSLVNHLRLLYSPIERPPPDATERTPIVTAGAVDSGYLSETEGEELDPTAAPELGKDEAYERSFSKEWLLMLVRRSEEWFDEVEGEERAQRERLVDEAAALVASLAETSASGQFNGHVLEPGVHDMGLLIDC